MACMETQKPDAVLDSCLIICFMHRQSLQNNEMFWVEIGAKQPNYGQSHTVWWHRLVRSDTVILADRNLDRTVQGNYSRYCNYSPNSNFTA